MPGALAGTAGRRRVPPLAIIALVALVYCAWLGAWWLRLSYTTGELSIYASRLWDLQRELARSGKIPWWSASYLNGSSVAFTYAGDLPLVPWVLVWQPLGVLVAVKLVTLTSIGLSGVTMFLCARHLLKSDAAATLAALGYLLHPALLSNAAWTEHICVVVFAALLPLAWLFFARALEGRRLADIVGCAVVLTLLVWSQNKYALEQGLFLAGFAGWSLARTTEGRAAKLSALAKLGALTALLAAFILVPPLTERTLVKLFEGDPLEDWRRAYSVTSLGALVHRSQDEVAYAGISMLALAGTAILFGQRRPQRGLFWLLVAFDAASLALGHGLDSVGLAAWRALSSVLRAGPLSSQLAVVALTLGLVAFAIAFTRRKLTTSRRRLTAFVLLAAFLAIPWFRIVALAPFFGDIRAPASFWELPGAFFGALLAGFFVTDVIARGRFEAQVAPLVAALGALFVIDAWPFQHAMRVSDVSPATIERARAMYGALGDEANRELGKVYVIGGPFHVMGPSWGGPPMTTEGTAYMSPRGSGRLAAEAGKTLTLQRAYFDLVGVHWLVFDKNDPRSHTFALAKQLAAYRRLFAVAREDEDFVVFRIPHPRPYVSGYARAALAYGDAAVLPELALMLAHRGILLVSADGERPEDATPERLAPFDAVYLSSAADLARAGEAASKVTVLGDALSLPALPPKATGDDPLTEVAVAHESAEKIRTRFVASAPCTAVVDESEYPYWHATLDGAPVAIERVAYGLMGVPVEAGAHEIVLTYEAPRAYGWAAIASGIAFVVSIAAAAWEAWRPRNVARA